MKDLHQLTGKQLTESRSRQAGVRWRDPGSCNSRFPNLSLHIIPLPFDDGMLLCRLNLLDNELNNTKFMIGSLSYMKIFDNMGDVRH
ncbi:hypothetical protein AAY473_023929 [Plecturocebus cupreus]